MNRTERSYPIRACARVALVLLAAAAAAALLAFWTLAVAGSGPDFGASYSRGPRFADQGDVITYTIVALNSGDAAQGVVLSDTLPVAVSLVPDSCRYSRAPGDQHPCGPLTQLWTEGFDAGDRVTTTFAVLVQGGTLNWPLVNRAYLSWDTGLMAMVCTTTLNPVRTHLPLLVSNHLSLPDLRVSALTVDSVSLEVGQPVTIGISVENAGEAAAGPFWVDLYLDPDPPPTAPGQPWDALCSGPSEQCFGIAWHVEDGLLPGHSVHLSSLTAAAGDHVHWPGHFVTTGTHRLYAFADSRGGDASHGAVHEEHEGLDNCHGPISVTVAEGCYEALVNGAFESSAGWALHHAAYDTTVVQDGLRSLRTGVLPGEWPLWMQPLVGPGHGPPVLAGTNLDHVEALDIVEAVASGPCEARALAALATTQQAPNFSSGRQELYLPPHACLRLTYWSYPISEWNDPGDFHYVILQDQSGQNYWLNADTRDTRTWEWHQHDLSRYAGQTVTLYFGTYNDGDALTSALFVDGASLEACVQEGCP